MRNLLYIIAIIAIVLWAIGYIDFGTSHVVQVMLLIAVVVIVHRVIRGK